MSKAYLILSYFHWLKCTFHQKMDQIILIDVSYDKFQFSFYKQKMTGLY